MLAEGWLDFRRHSRVFIFAVIISLCSGLFCAAEQNSVAGPARYRVFSLIHISAEQGKDFLAQLGIETVSKLPTVNALLVTASPVELVTASTLLELIDSEEQFVIKALSPVSKAENLPALDRIAAQVGDISIGTFASPPGSTAQSRAIIDVHGDSVIAIAPAQEAEKIVTAIEQIQKTQSETTSQHPEPAEANVPAEPNQPTKTEPVVGVAQANDTQPDELFGRLLDSIAEAEKKAGEPAATIEAEPNEPAVPSPESPQPLPQVATAVQAPPKAVVAEEPNVETILEPAKQKQTELDVPARSYEPAPIVSGEEMLELDLPEKLDIIDLLDLVGKYLHLDYLYDSGKVKGDVALKLQGPIKVRDLYPLLESVMRFRGFVMSRKLNLVTIVPTGESLDIDPTLLDVETGKVQYGDVVVTRVFEMQYVHPDNAKNLLINMKLGASMTSIPETGTLVVTEYAYRMQRVEELLEMIDKPGEPREFRFRQLRYTMAQTLAPKIKTLAEHLGTISVSVAAPPQAPKQQPRRRRSRRPTPPQPGEKSQTQVYLDVDERTNRILMIGFEGQLDIVNSLIDTLDVEQQDLRTLRLYDVQNVGADEVILKLQELGIIGGTGATTRTRTGTRTKITKTAQKGTAAAASTDSLVEEPQVIIIESTNSLLVNATAEQHLQIATIMSFVDSKTLEETIPYVIYPLENQSPEDMATVLNQLVEETIKDKEGKIEKVIRKDEDIIIIPDENTFSLIVYASKKNQEWIRKLITDLDKRRPQVLIDVTLVEISQTDTFNYDLELISSFPDLGTTAGIVGGISGTTTSAIMSALTSAHRDRFIDTSSKQGTGKGFYADEHIHALLTLMKQKDYGRVLAKPKILVNDNETGSISTANTTYVARSSQTAIPTGETVVETSFTFDPFVSGINLDITPHISEGDLLRLEISMSRSTQSSAGGTNAPPPDKTENKIGTIVTVPDDSTIILGGILTLDQAKNGKKVPLLGDIPLVGGLFRTIDNSDIQSKLYVFVKANILRPSEFAPGLPDLERISDRNRMAFEKSEKTFQTYEQWPGIKPEPMEPVHVLEAE